MSVAPTRTPLILCVEDYENILAGWEMLLKREGYTVLTAAGWNEALRLFDSCPIDLVILDHDMQCTACEFMVSVLKGEKPNVPILLLSDEHPSSKEEVNSVEASLLKSDPITVFLSTIATLLRSETRRPTLSTIAPRVARSEYRKEVVDRLSSINHSKAA